MEHSWVTPVLDHGFVELVESMGSDLRAVEAARVSFQKGLSSKRRDRALIDYLMEHNHLSPFEHIVFTFRIKTPLFVARQWLRHRIASVNEISQRYSEMEEEFYIPDAIRGRDPVNHQGSVPIEDPALQDWYIQTVQNTSHSSYRSYHEALEKGISREMARIILPLNLYTQWMWTVNLRSLMNFLSLRADSHAQWEIQQYAQAIARFVERTCPWSYTSFLAYQYQGDRLQNQQERDGR